MEISVRLSRLNSSQTVPACHLVYAFAYGRTHPAILVQRLWRAASMVHLH